MWRLIVAAAVATALGALAQPAAAQTATCMGVYQNGACYVAGGNGDQNGPYWPTNNETAYYYGPYAVAPGYGPYLQLGGDSGWNPNIGTTYNGLPPADFYGSNAFPYLAVSPFPPPVVVQSYYGIPYNAYPAYPCCWPAFTYFGP